jgi:predicted protein tyrosine phosphatase
MAAPKMNLLFICSRNQWRSPTAEAIYKTHPLYNARSAGTAEGARVKVNQGMMDWADVTFVMEKKHKQVIQESFQVTKEIVVLDIPDEYRYMDKELIEMIKSSVGAYLQ